MIRERGGKLCLLTRDGRRIADTGIGTDVLPESERARLRDGIEIKASDLAEYLRQKKAASDKASDTSARDQ